MQRRTVVVALFPLYCLTACTEGTRDRESGLGPGGSSGAVGAAGTTGTSDGGSGGDIDVTCPARGGAQLEVLITGLPEGVDASVIVGGPIEGWGVLESRSLGSVDAAPYNEQAERETDYAPILRTKYDVKLAESHFCM
jgi:hypothetical protein